MSTGKKVEKEYPLTFRKMVVMDLLTSGKSVQEIAEKYNLRHFNTVTVWKKQLKRMYGEDLINVLPQEASPALREQKDHIEKRNNQLQKALEDANLKITALETLIEIAEKDFKIQIRKKGGSKQ
jgi:transposase